MAYSQSIEMSEKHLKTGGRYGKYDFYTRYKTVPPDSKNKILRDVIEEKVTGLDTALPPLQRHNERKVLDFSGLSLICTARRRSALPCATLY